MIWFTEVATPIGAMLLVKTNRGLSHAYLENLAPSKRDPSWTRDASAFRAERQQLDEYFDGKRTKFDLALDPRGTPFQLRVWSALRDVAYGRTASYGEIARAVGRPRAFRAVGATNGKNPIAIIVPCHRIIGSSGALVGYAGGMNRKRWLLDHERRYFLRYTEMIGTPSCVST
jgi:methylated-DNA-[protein]-cysteine S-methyltransferase